MKKISNPIIFFGNERLATGVTTTAPTLTRLIESGYNITAVIASNDFSASRKQRRLEVADVAKTHGIPVLLPKRLSEIREDLQLMGADTGILVAYGKMVPQSIIDIFSRGIINIHPSLLPLHRGPTPIESVILNGENKTGVSLMSLVKEMDAGPVYAQETLKLQGAETKQELADRLLKKGSDLLLGLLPEIIAGNVEPKPQNDSRATYDSLISKKDGAVDWQKSAVAIEREIRAYATWPGSHTILAGKEVIITKARSIYDGAKGSRPGDISVEKKSGNILVSTKDGALAIEYLKPAGKQEMPTNAFVAGHRHLLGLD